MVSGRGKKDQLRTIREAIGSVCNDFSGSVSKAFFRQPEGKHSCCLRGLIDYHFIGHVKTLYKGNTIPLFMYLVLPWHRDYRSWCCLGWCRERDTAFEINRICSPAVPFSRYGDTICRSEWWNRVAVDTIYIWACKWSICLTYFGRSTHSVYQVQSGQFVKGKIVFAVMKRT